MLVGIFSGGAWVAERLHRTLALTVPLGVLAVTLHRDDFGSIGLHRESRRSQIPVPVDGREVVLVDDVLHTGRTVRAAINELFDFGRPRSVRLAVLADRGGRQLPVAADFTGAMVEVARDEELVLSNESGGSASQPSRGRNERAPMSFPTRRAFRSDPTASFATCSRPKACRPR